MPTPSQLLQGFGLVPGANIGGFTIFYAYATHTTIIRNKEYTYNITLKIIPTTSSDINQPYIYLHGLASESRIIYSSYGNPYSCRLHEPQAGSITRDHMTDGGIIITLTADSHRV